MLESIEKTRKFIEKYRMNVISSGFFDDMEVYLQAIEEEVAERYIEGPTDKNGDPITYRTMIDQWGALEYIACEMYLDGTYEWFVRGHDTSAPLLKASEVEAFNPPTVEDVLQEFVIALDRRGHLSNGVATTIAEYAERLQLKEDE